MLEKDHRQWCPVWLYSRKLLLALNGGVSPIFLRVSQCMFAKCGFSRVEGNLHLSVDEVMRFYTMIALPKLPLRLAPELKITGAKTLCVGRLVEHLFWIRGK